MVHCPLQAAPGRWGRLVGRLPALTCLMASRMCLLQVAKVLRQCCLKITPLRPYHVEQCCSPSLQRGCCLRRLLPAAESSHLRICLPHCHNPEDQGQPESCSQLGCSNDNSSFWTTCCIELL